MSSPNSLVTVVLVVLELMEAASRIDGTMLYALASESSKTRALTVKRCSRSVRRGLCALISSCAIITIEQQQQAPIRHVQFDDLEQERQCSDLPTDSRLMVLQRILLPHDFGPL